MTVADIVKLLIDQPWDAEVCIHVPGESESRRVERVQAIPKGPFGIVRPDLVSIDASEEIQ